MRPRIQRTAAALFALSMVVATAHAAAPNRLTEESFAQIRARYAGQPLVVHIWGMSCGPCVGELPKWGQLRRSHPAMNLVLIQADASPAEATEKTLKDAGLAKAESWAAPQELDEYLRASIDPKWIGDMPRTLLVSSAGKIETLRGVADLAAVQRWLQQQQQQNDPAKSSNNEKKVRP